MALRYNEQLTANRSLQIILGGPITQDILCASFVSFVIFVVKNSQPFVKSKGLSALSMANQFHAYSYETSRNQ